MGTEPQQTPPSSFERAADVAKIAKAGAAGASTGGAAGAAVGAGTEALKIAAQNPKNRERLHKLLVGGVAVLLALVITATISVMALLGGSGSQNTSGLQRAAHQAGIDAGQDANTLAYISAEARRLGVPWEVLGSLYVSQSRKTDGIGPWHLAETEAANVPVWTGGPCRMGATPAPTASASPDTDAQYAGAKNLCASTTFVAIWLRDVLSRERSVDTGLDLGDGAVVDKAAGTVTWPDQTRFQATLIKPYAAALQNLPFPTPDEPWATEVITRAIYWHLGLQMPCDGLGLSASGPGAASVVASGAWTQPTIDADGALTALGVFGMRFHPIYHEWRMHNGIDIGNNRGTPVWAVSNGKVTIAEDGCSEGLNFDSGCTGAGNYIQIDHGGSIASRYVHLTSGSLKVKVGDMVQAGQLIAVMGSTGSSTAPHLHFEIRISNEPIDPVPFMTERGVNVISTTAPPPVTPSATALSASTPAAATTSLTTKTLAGETLTLNATQLKNAEAIVSVGRELKMDSNAILAALATASAESDFQNLANDHDATSLSLPHDAVAKGGPGTLVADSLGILQQRPSMGWGTTTQLMDVKYQAKTFFGAQADPPGVGTVLVKNPALATDPAALAQAVQRSSYPTRYADRLPVAQDVLNALGGTLLPGPVGAAFCAADPSSASLLGAGFPTSDRNVGDNSIMSANGKQIWKIIVAAFETPPGPVITQIVAYPPDPNQPPVPVSGQSMPVYLTGYTFGDNTPPGSAAIAKPILHQKADGTGTFTDPITFAVAAPGNNWVLPPGTKIYVPFVKRYFIAEDTGDDFMANPPTGKFWFDLWIAGFPEVAAQKCASMITGGHTAVVNAGAGYPVNPGPVMIDGRCDAGFGDTPGSDPGSKSLGVMVPGAGTSSFTANGDAIAAWLVQNAAPLTITKLVWNHQVWTSQTQTWAPLPSQGSAAADGMDRINVTIAG